MPLLVVVAGPTASGKTGVAIQLAKYFKTEILSADSRQCYQELNIGVARPGPDELAAVPHHFIASHSIHQKIDAAFFEKYALDLLAKLFDRYPVVIAVGGTGLYLKALCEGVDRMPEIPEDIRSNVRRLFAEKGMEGLVAMLQHTDPLFYTFGEAKNPQRVMRALEVAMTTGKSIRSFQKNQPANRPFRISYLGMDVAKDVLHAKINSRVDNMMQMGLLDEAKELFPCRSMNALQTVGYVELFDYLEGKYDLAEAIELIKMHTRQYAKRQLTWFKKAPGIQWVSPADINKMICLIEQNQG